MLTTIQQSCNERYDKSQAMQIEHYDVDPERKTDMPDVRARVLEAASKLIAKGGVTALTTRALATAAAVQAPTLYRLFGEKQGLLSAVAEYELAAFVSRKQAAKPNPDPVQELRDAWDSYVDFGLAHPAVFAIMNEIGAPTSNSPATLAGIAVLRERVQRIARAGRLNMPIEHAVALIHAAGVGTIAALLSTPPERRDLQLSSLAREAMLSAMLVDAPALREKESIASFAVALAARLDEVGSLTPGERLLLLELLNRLSSVGCG